MKRLFSAISAFFLVGPLLFSQTDKLGLTDKINAELDRGPSVAALEKEAALRYNNGDYYAAMQLYARALEADTMNVKALEGYGKAAYDFYALRQADWAYSTLLNNNLGKADQSTLLRLADIKYRKGNYQEAKDLYYKYLFVTPPAERRAEDMDLAQERMERCDWAIALLRDADIQVVTTHLDTFINSPYAEYAPRLFEQKLYFSSYRFPHEKDKEKPKRHLIRMMRTDELGTDSLADVHTTSENSGEQHNAYATFSADGQTMYYCECTYTEMALFRCDIFRRKRAQQDWGAAQKLPETINNPLYTNTQPATGKLPDGREVLFFVSDRPGKGGRDIWYSLVNGDDFGAPVNLSAINTSKDEVTPWFHDPTQTLYYSTNGPATLGGFDIYKSEYAGGNWSAPKHTGAELNSSANDVYFSLSPSGKTGFLSSNRAGAINYSEEACCYDIFKVDISKPEMVAVNFNKFTGDSLPETTMRLVTMESNRASEEFKMNVASPSQEFKVSPNKQYLIITDKDHYVSDTVAFSTPKTMWEERIVQKLYLEPKGVRLIVTIFDKETRVPLLSTTTRLNHLSQRNQQGIVQVGKNGEPIQSLMSTKSETNRYEYFLEFDSEYDITGTKPGYTSSTDKVSTVGVPRGATIEKQLFLTRGVELDAYALDDLSDKPLRNVTFRLVNLTTGKVDVKTNPTSNDYYQVLDYESRYRIVATKENYTTDSLEFSTVDLPKQAFQHITRELRLRSLNLPDYLPVVLYFDNDNPNPRTMLETTKKEYRETYVEYYRKKEEFINAYTKGMTPDQASPHAAEINSFFEDSIKTYGWDKLMTLSEMLYEILENGDSVEITLKGYASPLASSAYNFNLTERRVASVYNHFRIFDGGIYNKHLKSGRLTIKREPNGSSKAPATVSGDPKDRRNAVYSVAASRERRVEIIGVSIKQTLPNQ